MNILWLVPVPFAARLVGMGILPRIVSLPIASLMISVSLVLAMNAPPWWIPVLAALFVIGRIPNVANGIGLVNRSPVDPNKDSFTTKWITHIAGDDAFSWALLRINVYYLPFFAAVSYAVDGEIFTGITFSCAYAFCWACSYYFAKPIWNKLRSPVTPNCYTILAETIECIAFGVILAILLVLP